MSMRGSHIINNTIDKLPFEIHIPIYSYCGPGTDLQKRLNRNDPGINVLDEACKYHDTRRLPVGSRKLELITIKISGEQTLIF